METRWWFGMFNPANWGNSIQFDEFFVQVMKLTTNYRYCLGKAYTFSSSSYFHPVTSPPEGTRTRPNLEVEIMGYGSSVRGVGEGEGGFVTFGCVCFCCCFLLKCQCCDLITG